jgi:hypothetical protein
VLVSASYDVCEGVWGCLQEPTHIRKKNKHRNTHIEGKKNIETPAYKEKNIYALLFLRCVY